MPFIQSISDDLEERHSQYLTRKTLASLRALIGEAQKRGFKPLMRKCGIVDGAGNPRFDFHFLRHAAASLMI